jgi:endo-1,4-beta-xylanase
MMERRKFLQQVGLAAGTVGWLAPGFAEEQVPPSLKEAAARRGLHYGATDENALATAPPEFRALFARHCGLLAPSLSWYWVARAPGQYDFARQQFALDFAREHQMRLTGAHLLWHERTPDFFTAAPDAARARQLIVDHINFMCKKFTGQIWSWNVVNEALNPKDGRPDGLRQSLLLAKLGTEFFDIGFHTAREADPQAILVYNDYDMEYDSPESEARRRALVELLDSFLQRRLPIDAIGLQAHIKLQRFRFSPTIYRDFLKEIAARGVRILLTELDVLDVGAPSGIAERDQAVADAYRRVLDVALDEKALAAVITWGLSDRYTWLNPQHTRSFGRPDGLPGRPLPFDDQFQPKPAYWALLKCLESAPQRPLLERS